MRTLIISSLLFFTFTVTARAEDGSHEAGRHFSRGVELYTDGDFRGALAEFRRAYELWPRASVLYNIGQTQYQLLDYAGSLRSMERYLNETGGNAPHRQEVEKTVETLRGRVGHVALASELGCDVLVDDQPLATTPLDAPLLVSVGARKLLVACPGGRQVSKRIEVAAGETLHLDLRPAPAAVSAALAPSRAAEASTPVRAFVPAWVVTGFLVAGTFGLGTATLVEERQLSGLRNQYPGSQADLNRTISLIGSLALGTDILGAASIVGIALSSYLTARYYQSERRPAVRLGGTPHGRSTEKAL